VYLAGLELLRLEVKRFNEREQLLQKIFAGAIEVFHLVTGIQEIIVDIGKYNLHIDLRWCHWRVFTWSRAYRKLSLT
jgi:hypothetical protein